MNRKMIGDKQAFGIEYEFLDDSHDIEIAMYVSGVNILHLSVMAKL